MNTQTMQARSYPTASITRAAAAALIEAAREAAGRIGIEVAVAVTDSAGSLKLFKRADGAPFLTSDVATGKAWTAPSYGIPTHVWSTYLTEDPKVAQLAKSPGLCPWAAAIP